MKKLVIMSTRELEGPNIKLGIDLSLHLAAVDRVRFSFCGNCDGKDE